MTLLGFFVAATVVTLLQFLRVKEWRLLPLMALFACLAAAHGQADWQVTRYFHFAAGFAGLVLLLVLSPRHRASH